MDPLDRVAALIRTGRFLEAFQELELCRTSNKTAANIRRVEILERVGRHDECRILTNRLLDSKQLTAAQKATCHYVAGSLLLEQGDTEAATRHLQRAVSVARQSDDLELLCNVQLKFLGLVADLSGPDGAAPVLSELRRNTIRLGSPYATAGVHVFVAQMEASRGLFRSAHRHLRIATHLTSSFQSPWLEAHSENIKLAICVLQSDIEQGQKHAVLGRRLADECGAATIRRAVAANQALLYLLAGNFSDASESINRALVILASAGERRNGCLDTFARIRLAEGRLDECEAALDCIEESIRLASDQSMYANRYASFTRCQLLCRQGRLEDALLQARSVETLALKIDDRLLLESARLTRAELLQATGRRVEATLALELAADQFHDFSPELYVQYERTIARALRDRSLNRAACLHYERAQRICSSIKNAPTAFDLERCWNESAAQSPLAIQQEEFYPQRCEQELRIDVIHSIAAMIAHIGRAEFIAYELAAILTSACKGCYIEVRTRSADEASRVIHRSGSQEANSGRCQ